MIKGSILLEKHGRDIRSVIDVEKEKPVYIALFMHENMYGDRSYRKVAASVMRLLDVDPGYTATMLSIMEPEAVGHGYAHS